MVFSRQPIERERPSDMWGTIGRLFGYLREYRLGMAILIVITLTAIVVDIACPLLIEGCINAFWFSDGIRFDERGFGRNITLLILLYATNGILGYLHGIVSSKITLSVEKKLRQVLVGRIIRCSVRDTEQLAVGELISRTMNDTRLASETFFESLLTLFASVVVITGCMIVMLIRCKVLAVVAMTASFISVAVIGFLSGKLFPVFMSRQASLGKLSAHAEESFDSIRTCMANDRTGENIRLAKKLAKEYYGASLKADVCEGVMAPSMMLLANLSFLAILFTGTLLVMRGMIGLGTLQAFILYSRQLTEPLSELGDSFAQVQSSLASSERVFELCDISNEPVFLPGNDRMGEKGKHIQFDNVSFSYINDHPVLSGLKLDIRFGEKIALVGMTGVGKTTLTSLMLRFYNDYDGRILFDGREIRSMALRELRSRVMIVPQEAAVIDGTIRDNIAYGSMGASLSDVVRASETVGLSEIIEKLPEKYDTVIKKENGILSQGQLQLMCLARTLLQEPEVLILDEAVNSVDAVTEQKIIKAMEASMAGRTCIIIAHRLASVVGADRICMMQNGVIVHSGTHSELMRRNNAYRQLFMAQFSGRET